MTKTEAVAEFAAEVLPGVLTAYGRHDRAALRTAWNDYADELAKSGRITERQADTWTQPDFARLIPPVGSAVTAHDVYVVEHGARPSTVYASCSCGWSGPPRRSMARVKQDQNDHRAESR